LLGERNGKDEGLLRLAHTAPSQESKTAGKLSAGWRLPITSGLWIISHPVLAAAVVLVVLLASEKIGKHFMNPL
jgi:hypothetical protein